MRLTFILILAPFFLFSQAKKADTEKEQIFSSKKKLMKSGGTGSLVRISKGDTTFIASYTNGVQSGTFVRKQNNGDTALVYTYEEGLRSGRWLYKIDVKRLAVGVYIGDKKVGIWEYDDHTNGLTILYDHDLDSIVSDASSKKKYEVFKGGNLVQQSLDRIPFNPDIYTTIHEELSYPKEPQKISTSGISLLELTISKTGEIVAQNYVLSAGTDAEKQISNMINRIKDGFKPALKNGIPVKVKIYLKVEYKMDCTNCPNQISWSLH